MHKPDHVTPADFIINHSGMLKWSDESVTRRQVLDHATVKLRTVYVAVEATTVATGERTVTAFVFLTQKYKGDGRYQDNNFGVKGLHEESGPCEVECPQRILDLLTPTTVQYALDWRKACHETIARAAVAKTIQPGMDITLYGKQYHVDARLGPKGVLVTAAGGGMAYRINLVQLKEAVIVLPAPALAVQPIEAAPVAQQQIEFEEDDEPAEAMRM